MAEVLAGDPDERLGALDVFAGHLVLTLRAGRRPLLRVVRPGRRRAAADRSRAPRPGAAPAGATRSSTAAAVTVAIESLTEPTAWFDVDLATGARTLLKRLEVPATTRPGM